jgi:hypothetical protein
MWIVGTNPTHRGKRLSMVESRPDPVFSLAGGAQTDYDTASYGYGCRPMISVFAREAYG